MMARMVAGPVILSEMARTAAGPASLAEMATAIASRVEWRLGCLRRGWMVAAPLAGVMGILEAC